MYYGLVVARPNPPVELRVETGIIAVIARVATASSRGNSNVVSEVGTYLESCAVSTTSPTATSGR
jgi:hypothetical protein